MRSHRVLQGVLAAVVVVSTIFAQQSNGKKNDRKGLPAGKQILWSDPGDVASLDFRFGVGGEERQPQPPFRFIKEDLSGTTDKINVMDDRGVAWNVKWGHEARPTTFCTRLAWACGYYATAEYFLPQGRIENVKNLTRARTRVSRDGSFENARFQLRVDSPKFLKDQKWTWADNPVSGSHELEGLKLLTVLVSNADAKDANLGIFADDHGGAPRYLYAVIDWGSSLGKWGNAFTRSVWDCNGFADQSSKFVKGIEDGRVRLGFSGKHNGDLTDELSVAGVEWLMQYLGKITDKQLRDGFAASGATQDDTECFAQAMRSRIEQLRSVVESPARTSTAGLTIRGLLESMRDSRLASVFGW